MELFQGLIDSFRLSCYYFKICAYQNLKLFGMYVWGEFSWCALCVSW